MVKIIPISSVEDLQNMGKDGYYKLTKNINCEDFDFESIHEFHGTLDGAGHTVKNLNCNTENTHDTRQENVLNLKQINENDRSCPEY